MKMLNRLVIHNVYTAGGKTDPAVGISIAKIGGDENYGLYCATLGPFKRVGAHVHKTGVETYQIIEGAGTMHTGRVGAEGQVHWSSPVPVHKGDVFTIHAEEVHQLVNTNAAELLVVFGCSASHLGDDRILVTGIKD
jgi:mannose-6-phosphate isomerase-like protein (cupin superfamily)